MIRVFLTTPKTNSTIKKIYIALFRTLALSHKKCNWIVTRIYSHYTFKQSKFKKDFVIINHDSRQKSKTNVKKDFFKLLNNANFSNDCKNNVDHCFSSPLFDENGEIYYVKKY